jgi:pilus assembly protein Flp/PilA
VRRCRIPGDLIGARSAEDGRQPQNVLARPREPERAVTLTTRDHRWQALNHPRFDDAATPPIDRRAATNLLITGDNSAARSDHSAEGEDSDMKNFAVSLMSDEQGQDLIEYGLLIGIITVGCIVSINAIGPKVATYFSNLNANLP